MMLSNLPTYGQLPTEVGSFRWAGAKLGVIIADLLPLAYAFSGLGLLAYFIMGGFKLLTSGGDPKAMAAGGKILTNAIVGFLIVIASYWIIQIVEIIFNITILG